MIEAICQCGHDAALHPQRMIGRKLQPRDKCYASSGCSCVKYQSAFADIDPGIHRYVNSKGQECDKDGTPIKPIPLPSCRGCGKLNVEGACETCAAKFFIKQEDAEPSWRPSLNQQMEDRHMHAYLRKQHEDLKALCGKDIADMMYGPIDTDKCYISGCTCGKPKNDRQTEDDMDPKATDPKEKLNLSDWDKLNNEVTALIGNSKVHNKHILSLFEKVGDLTETTTKLMDTLETQLGSIRDLHDTVKTQTGMIERTNETVSGNGGILDKLLETVASQSRSIERLHNNTADLQKRVKSLEVSNATNYLPIITDAGKDSNISAAGTRPKGSGNISVNIPQTTQPSKDNTSKLLLKRFLAVQRICEASIDLDTHRAVAPSDDRQWLAQSILNILKGNVDE